MINKFKITIIRKWGAREREEEAKKFLSNIYNVFGHDYSIPYSPIAHWLNSKVGLPSLPYPHKIHLIEQYKKLCLNRKK